MTAAFDADSTRTVAVLGPGRRIRVSGSPQARIAAIAATQRGRVARRQLLAAGLGAARVDHLLRSGRLFSQHHGVYAVGHPGPVPLGTETAALLAVRDGAMLSDRWAVRGWGLTSIAPDPSCVDVLLGPGPAIVRAGIRAHRSTLLSSTDRRYRFGLPVCSVARVLLDLAADPALDDRRLLRLHDEAQIAGVVGPRDVDELLGRTAGHCGHRRLSELAAAEAGRGPTRSEAEARALAMVRDGDLPLPRVNARVHGYEVDLHWPPQRLVVEIDGYRFHRTRERFERDRLRDARLQAAGIEVLRITWRQLEHEPFAVVARIAAALARRTRD